MSESSHTCALCAHKQGGSYYPIMYVYGSSLVIFATYTNIHVSCAVYFTNLTLKTKNKQRYLMVLFERNNYIFLPANFKSADHHSI